MKTKRFSIISTFFVFLSGVLTVPLFAAEEEAAKASGAVVQSGVVGQTGIIQSVFDSVKISLTKLGAYLPKLGGLTLILIAGALVGLIAAVLVKKFLKIIRVEKLVQKLKISEILKNGGIKLPFSELIAEIVFFLIIIGTLIAALEFYGVATTPLMDKILSYIPNVVTAVFVLVLGGFLSVFVSGVITLVGENVRIAQSATLGHIAKYAIIIFVGLIALKELGLGVILTDNSSNIILGGLVLAFAVAFGLGAKEKAGNFLSNVFKK